MNFSDYWRYGLFLHGFKKMLLIAIKLFYITQTMEGDGLSPFVVSLVSNVKPKFVQTRCPIVKLIFQ